MRPVKIARVHVGCGPQNIMEGWWNVDIRSFPGIDEVFDVREAWPWKDLEYVYGEHFIEHLDLSDALLFLENAGNSLAVGGIIRLSTPNLAWVIETHFHRESASAEERIRDTMVFNRAFYGWGHKFLFTRELIQAVLESMGFCDVNFPAYGESNVPDLRGLERHGGYSVDDGLPSVIISEAARCDRIVSIPDSLRKDLNDAFIKYVRSGH